MRLRPYRSESEGRVVTLMLAGMAVLAYGGFLVFAVLSVIKMWPG